MARILVTGAAGFIGSHLLRTLRGRHEVFGLVRSIPKEPSTGDVQWIEHDLTRRFVGSHLPGKVDAIIHLAQSKNYRDFPAQSRDIFDVNVQSTFHLLEYARQAGASCFVFASTGGLYGFSDQKFVEGDPVTLVHADPTNTLSFYFSSKLAGEQMVASYQRFFNTVVLRLFFVYGESQKSMLIASFVEKIKGGQPVVIQGNPGIRINPINVEDASRTLEAATELSGSSVINVAGDEVVTITDLVGLIEKASGYKAKVSHTNADSEGDIVGANDRMKETLGVHPQVSLLEGLGRLV